MNLLAGIVELARLGKVNTARALASHTGGGEFSFLLRGTLERVVQRIGSEIHTQYVVSYTPREPRTAGFHTIRVEVKNRPGLKARARAGYWPAPDAAR